MQRHPPTAPASDSNLWLALGLGFFSVSSAGLIAAVLQPTRPPVLIVVLVIGIVLGSYIMLAVFLKLWLPAQRATPPRFSWWFLLAIAIGALVVFDIVGLALAIDRLIVPRETSASAIALHLRSSTPRRPHSHVVAAHTKATPRIETAHVSAPMPSPTRPEVAIASRSISYVTASANSSVAMRTVTPSLQTRVTAEPSATVIATMSSQPEAASPSGNLRFFQELTKPPLPGYRYTLQLTVQADHVMNPFSIIIYFSKGEPRPMEMQIKQSGMMSGTQFEQISPGMQNGQYYLRVKIGNVVPPVSPETPFVVFFPSQNDIEVSSVKELPYDYP